ADLRRHRQLCYVGSPNAEPDLKSRIFGSELWTFNDVGTLRAMVSKGLGWGLATPHFFREEFALCQGTPIDCRDPRLLVNCPVWLVWQMDRIPRPLGNELMKSLVDSYSPPLDLAIEVSN